LILRFPGDQQQLKTLNDQKYPWFSARAGSMKPGKGHKFRDKQMPTNLMGINVGFSKTRRTTGIACLDVDQLSLKCARTAWQSREAQIPNGFQPSVIAIDGPLLPLGADLHMRRHVEPLFICAPFHITVGDPALVVIVGRRIGVASGIHSDSLQRTGS
jgi:hypothetical protein